MCILGTLLGGLAMTNFAAPTTCTKCGGLMEEGLAVDNGTDVHKAHPAYGTNVSMGGSASWWQIVDAEPNSSAGPFGDTFRVDKVIHGDKIQIFTYRCTNCGYLEAYAPDL
jgi:hypothetical protein